jgi:ribosomal peptide maturation radical SAM protein 1
MLSAVLVSMPFMDADRPSIQLGLLTAIAASHGFRVRAVHANLEFAAQLGVDDYRRLAGYRGRLLGEWLFAVEAFGDDAPDPEGAFLEAFSTDLRRLHQPHENVGAWLQDIRVRIVPTYLDALLDQLDWTQVQVVGFSCTFQQNMASFALARRLKARFPRLVTVFGGANFDGEMGPELARSVDCIDVAVVGEADEAFPRLLGALDSGEEPGTIPGVVSRLSGELVATPPAPVDDLDGLPVPDYTDYFDRAERLGLMRGGTRRRTWIPLETSRGCWWGAKHHCVFCGLNATTMRFRSKSSTRVLQELASLARTSRSFHFACVDNILDPRYLTDLLPSICESGADYHLFYEVKSNLNRAQLRLMAQAGVTHIQPGLESLSTTVLHLMRKGVTAGQNVNVLRWARYYGIDVAWNILWGIPGETSEDYVRQSALAKQITHLQPPSSVGRIWLERFSPLFDLPADQFDLKAPERSYGYVYPPEVDLSRAAYFFDFELHEALPTDTYDGLRQATREWRKVWNDARPELTYWSAPGLLQVLDGRRPGRRRSYTFEGEAADIYVACSNRPRSPAAVHDALHLRLGVDEVLAIVRDFERLGLMMLDGGHALALGLPAVAGR